MPSVESDLTLWRIIDRIARGDTLTEAAARERLSIYAASRLLAKFEEESGLSPLDRRHTFCSKLTSASARTSKPLGKMPCARLCG